MGLNRQFERRYVGFRILRFFLFNPRISIHIKALSKKLKVSPSTTNFFCDLFSKDDILKLNKQGNMKIFSLNNESVYVKELKKVYALMYFKEKGIDKIANDVSIAIYGSYASGEFDENSDTDIIIIGNKDKVDEDLVLGFQNKIRKEVSLTILPYYKWEKMKKHKDPFALEVLHNHILIKGNPL